jgi:hypothetical protein
LTPEIVLPSKRIDGGALNIARRFTVFRPGVAQGPDSVNHGALKFGAICAALSGMAQISHAPILPRLARRNIRPMN